MQFVKQYMQNKKILNIPLAEWIQPKDFFVGLVISTLGINILGLVFPLFLLQIYDRIIPFEAYDTLYILCFAVVSAIVLETILKLARYYVCAWTDAKLSYKSSIKDFSHLIQSRFQAFQKDSSGVHIDRINSLDLTKDFFGGQTISSLLDVPFILIYLAIIFLIAPPLALVTLGSSILLIVWTKYANKFGEHNFLKRKKSDEIHSNFIMDVLLGMHTIKGLGMEPQVLRRYERLQNTSTLEDYEYSQNNTHITGIGSFITQFNLILTIVVGCLLVIQGGLSVGGLAGCTLLAGRIISPLNKLVELWNHWQSIKLIMQHHEKIIKLPLEPHTNEDSLDIKGRLILDNISFKHNKESSWLFKSVSLDIPEKSCIGLTSQQSKGYTSLMYLIMGFYKPNKGRILVDKYNINGEHDITLLRKKIAYLPQRGSLFEGTIMDNLTGFRGDIYEKRARYLAAILGLQPHIESMPNGFQTVVGNMSVEMVSLGIIQQIIIIRALVDDPKIILFDEANCALDSHSNKKLLEFLKSIKGKCTIIIASHHASYLSIADTHYFIDNQNLSDVQDNSSLGGRNEKIG